MNKMQKAISSLTKISIKAIEEIGVGPGSFTVHRRDTRYGLRDIFGSKYKVSTVRHMRNIIKNDLEISKTK